MALLDGEVLGAPGSPASFRNTTESTRLVPLIGFESIAVRGHRQERWVVR